jgi:signal transduction histidine kinase
MCLAPIRGHNEDMLHKLLVSHRSEILAYTRRLTAERTASKLQSAKLAEGLPFFYDILVETFRCAGAPSQSKVTAGHGKELFRLGYTVSQVVNAYGALCQAVTETAEKLGAKVQAREFSVLNATLDLAIAEAVSDFEAAYTTTVDQAEARRMGALVNAMRTSLETAVLAHTSMQQGLVGIAGSTNALLERNLGRMAELLNGALTDVRMRSEPKADLQRLRLIDAISEVEITASAQGRGRGVSLSFHVDPRLEVIADRNHVVSTLANLLQNAIKFSKTGAVIVVRGIEKSDTVAVEIEDECGGLPKGRIEELFRPFNQRSPDRTGAGLGLALSRRAMQLNKGTLSAVDLPGKGCVFTFALPKAPASRADARSSRSPRARGASPGKGRRRALARSAGRRGRPKRSARLLRRRETAGRRAAA